MYRLSLIALILFASNSFAKSYGTFGATFPIAEMSLLELIQIKVQKLYNSNDWNKINAKWLNKVKSHINHPVSLNLPRAQKTTTHYYIPKTSVKDINVLQQIPQYQPCWILFDAEDSAQINWAKKYISKCSKPKLILTGGFIKQTSNILNTTIYFDQKATITKKLQIDSVPALVQRRGDALQILQYEIKENGDVS